MSENLQTTEYRQYWKKKIAMTEPSQAARELAGKIADIYKAAPTVAPFWDAVNLIQSALDKAHNDALEMAAKIMDERHNQALALKCGYSTDSEYYHCDKLDDAEAIRTLKRNKDVRS